MQASLSYHEVMAARAAALGMSARSWVAVNAAHAAAAAEPVDRYHRGAGRDCPDCDPNRMPTGIKVTGWGEGLIGYPPALELEQVVIATPQLMPSIDDVGTLDMFEEFGL